MAKQSARIRGRYGSVTAIIIAATTGGYLKYEDYRLKEKDKRLLEKEVTHKKSREEMMKFQFYREQMRKIDENCREQFKGEKLTEDFLTQANNCIMNSPDYVIAHQQALKLYEESEKLSTTPKIGGG